VRFAVVILLILLLIIIALMLWRYYRQNKHPVPQSVRTMAHGVRKRLAFDRTETNELYGVGVSGEQPPAYPGPMNVSSLNTGVASQYIGVSACRQGRTKTQSGLMLQQWRRVD